MKASKAFRGVTPHSLLGRAKFEGGTKADIKATVKSSGDLILVEVKNTREVHYPNSKIFPPLIKNALKEGANPLLIVAHMSEEAIYHCERIGVAVLNLLRQVLPKSVSARDLELFERAFGREPYECIEFGRVRHRVSPRTDEDVRRLSDPMFMGENSRKWARTARLLSRRPELIDEPRPLERIVRELK
jgi:hypothetical protein